MQPEAMFDCFEKALSTGQKLANYEGERVS
jgi:hypothetical protein